VTPGELRELIREADIYKMSLGKSARYREEALQQGVLVFQTDVSFYNAVIAGNDAEILRAGKSLRGIKYPEGNPPDSAIGTWRRSIETFRSLPSGSLILHWEADLDHLHWAISKTDFGVVREETNDFGQPALVFHRQLAEKWQKISLGGVALSNIHPKARDLAINMATLNQVQTHTGYFRALLLDGDTSAWEAQSDWQEKAVQAGWYPKDRRSILADRRAKSVTEQIREVADHFEAEVERMTATAVQTAAYANGQTAIVTVKAKEIGFTRGELEEEIAYLFKEKGYCCALTGYDFKKPTSNPHLLPSLDRKDSRLGYIPGNLQVVTRAANFYKSASDEADWALKARALESMAFAIQNRRKAEGAKKIG